jgi:hypothetical protein
MYGTWEMTKRRRESAGYPPLFSELRILKDLKWPVFGTAHSKGFRGAFFGTAHSKGLSWIGVEILRLRADESGTPLRTRG